MQQEDQKFRSKRDWDLAEWEAFREPRENTAGPVDWWHTAPEFKMAAVAYREGDVGLFVRYEDGKLAFALFGHWVPEGIRNDILPEYAELSSDKQRIVIPVGIDKVFLLSGFEIRPFVCAETRSRFIADGSKLGQVWGDAIRRTRNKRGWSQNKLSEMSGIHQSALSRIESGRHEPRSETLDRIAHAMGISRHDLMLGNVAFRPFNSYW